MDLLGHADRDHPGNHGSVSAGLEDFLGSDYLPKLRLTVTSLFFFLTRWGHKNWRVHPQLLENQPHCDSRDANRNVQEGHKTVGI